MVTKNYIDQLTFEIIGCAIEVHKFVGPGLLESAYQKCFTRELELRKYKFQAERKVPLNYKGLYLETDLRLDVLVENLIIVELKAADALLPIHEAVLLT